MNYKAARAIITTLSIALFVASIMISNSPLRSETTKSSTSSGWCYVSAYPEDRWICFPDHEQCNKAYSLDIFNFDSCIKT